MYLAAGFDDVKRSSSLAPFSWYHVGQAEAEWFLSARLRVQGRSNWMAGLALEQAPGSQGKHRSRRRRPVHSAVSQVPFHLRLCMVAWTMTSKRREPEGRFASEGSAS